MGDTNSMNTVLAKALKTVKPSAKEQAELNDIVDAFLSRLDKAVKPDAEIVVGGSYAKGTWLRGNVDVDIFIRFDYDKFKGKDISLALFKKLSTSFKTFEKVHGSRDYFQKTFRGVLFEIIPVLEIKNSSQAENITDMSPLHASWVRKHRKYHDDIRLAKAFCKAQDVYGAESYLRGFSGYVLEILVISHGGFNRFISSVPRWKMGQVFDIEKHHSNVMRELNESKLQSPIIVIDPVQKGRNAAAALGVEKFNKLVLKAEQFLREPKESFFIKKKTSIKDLKEKAKGKHIFIIDAIPGEGKQDVEGSKLLKAYDYLRKQAILNDFLVLDSGWEWDKKEKAFFWYILDKDTLSQHKKWLGPPLRNDKHAQRFKEKYPEARAEGKFLVVDIKRKYTSAKDLLSDALRSSYVKEKIKGARLR